MRIVNSRVGEDQGPFTFTSRNGASVVDYLLCKECNFSNITCFNVNSMNEWSDQYTPISFSLSCNNVLVSDDDVYLSKYKWSQVHRDSFRANLIGQLPFLNQLTSIIERSQTCIHNVVSSFTNVIKYTADHFFLKTVRQSHPTSFVDTPSCNNAEWFDNECKKTVISMHCVFLIIVKLIK